MATRNIQMNYYNGSSYDQLYPQVNLSNTTGTLPLSDTSGTLAISRGGTGQTTATNAMYSLISGMSTTTSVATNDYIPIQDVSASGGRKVLVSNLISTIQSNISSGFKFKLFQSFSLNLAEDAVTTINMSLNDFKEHSMWYIKLSPSGSSAFLQYNSDSNDTTERIDVYYESLYMMNDSGLNNLIYNGRYLADGRYSDENLYVSNSSSVTLQSIQIYSVDINT